MLIYFLWGEIEGKEIKGKAKENSKDRQDLGSTQNRQDPESSWKFTRHILLGVYKHSELLERGIPNAESTGTLCGELQGWSFVCSHTANMGIGWVTCALYLYYTQGFNYNEIITLLI